MLRKTACPIDKTAIDDLSKDLLVQSACPYHTFISYANKVGSKMTTDRSHGVRGIIRKALASVLGRKNVDSDMRQILDQHELGVISRVKMQKHVYDVLFLQEGVYDIVQRALTMEGSPEFARLILLSQNANLQDLRTRNIWAEEFINVLRYSLGALFQPRQKEKAGDEEYLNTALRYSMLYSDLTLNDKKSFPGIFAQGINDATQLCLHLVYSIPELYKAKYDSYPDKDTYRQIVQQNMKQVLFPLATINLGFLTSVFRSSQASVIQDGLGINSDTFVLDENNSLIAKQNFIEKVISRTHTKVVNHYRQAQEQTGGDFGTDFRVTTGCPAMKAKTKDGKRMTEQFLVDFLALIDEIYFPYWDK